MSRSWTASFQTRRLGRYAPHRRDLLREKYEIGPTIDNDGDFVLHHMGQPVWVCVRPDQPAVVIMA